MVRLLAVALLLASACSSGTGTDECDDTAACAMATLPTSANGNYSLVVSNQSLHLPKVIIDVTIDGEGAVGGSFEVGNQHTYTPYRFELADGAHELRAEVVDTEAKTVATFGQALEVDGRRFGYLSFRTEDGRSYVAFEESDEPFTFG